MKRYPASEKAIHGPNVIVCGLPVKPGTEPVSLRSRHAPGFGIVMLLRNGKPVDCCSRADDHRLGHGDWERQPTLIHYEHRARQNPNARWTLRVDGPMSGYVLGRKRGQWYVIESLRGFA